MGSEYNAFTAKEYTGFWVKVDSVKLELAADIVSDMLLNSKLDPGEIEREKGVIAEEINMYHDNPMMYIEDVFEDCLYGNQPAGWETIGSKKNILRFKRLDFVNYLQAQYGANNTVVCLAGRPAGNPDRLINKFFNKFKSSNIKNKKAVAEKQTKPKIKIHYKKTGQANLSLGARTFPVGHRDELTLKVISIILGGSMSSRLFTELRERQGLAYYVRTQAEFYTDTGYLATQAGVPADKISQAIKIILDEYKKLTNKLVGSQELSRTKDLILGRTAIQLEASDNVASWYGRQMILRQKVLTPEEFLKGIKKVTAADIKKVAGKIFVNKGLNLAIIGPLKNKIKYEKILKL